MNTFLLRILGAPAGESGTVVSSRFELHPVWGWGLWALVAVLVVGVAFVSYRRRDVEMPPGRRIALGVLRGVALLMVLGVLLRPTLSLTVDGMVRQSLILLFDESASLSLRDPRTEEPDRVRAGIAEGRLPAAGGLTQSAPGVGTWNPMPARLDLLRGVITNRDLALLDRLGRTFDLRVSAFSSELGSLVLGASAVGSNGIAGSSGALPAVPLAMALRAEGVQTAPGTAMRELLERERGRPVGGVVVFTDGIRNSGSDPREAVTMAREAGIPMHFVGLGTTAPRDVQVVEVKAPDVSFVRDEVSVTARLRVRGLKGENLKVSLMVDGEQVEEREVVVSADGELEVPLRYAPSETGDVELSVETPVRKDEILAENNRQSRRLRVIDDRIRVLLVEQSPRWEFRYLQALLMRDRRVDLKCVLFDGDSAITRSPGSPYLDQIPARREDLFGYDLVVFGDVDPKNFTPAQLEVLTEFVAKSAGSFLMIAGRRFSPWGYRDTALERLLPVEFDRLPPVQAASSVHDRPLRVELTPEGRESGFLRMSEDPAENVRRWESLAPIFWTAPVSRAKPAAQVLLVDGSGPEGTPRTPIVAVQQYGVGQSLFVGTDNTWRWRRNEGEPLFVSFWARVVQRLAINHLLTGSRRTQMVLDRTSALRGEKIAVTGRLFTSSFEPLSEPIVRARVDRETRGAGAGGGASPTSELMLRAVPDQPGVFRGEIVASSPGRYRITLGEDAPAAVDFTVEERMVEAGETALQEATLREWASVGGGTFFREEDLHHLPEVVQSKAQRVQSKSAVEVWTSPLYYLVVLVLFGVEWGLRKWWQLK